MNDSEIQRRLNNFLQIGTIKQIDPSKALAKVNLLGRTTDFLPILSIANSFKRKFVPIRVDEQVCVFCPNGNSDFGIIIPSIFNKNFKEPNGANENKEISVYEDGTTVFYDVSTNTLSVDCVGDINIKAGGNITIKAGGNIDIDGARIDLN